MPEHTPGPWRVGRGAGTSTWEQGLPEGSVPIVSHGTVFALGLDVAAVPATGAPGDRHLIAAAPDMLAALHAYRRAAAALITDYVVPVLQPRGEPLPESICAAFNEARRLAVPAIAKAEGNSDA